MKPSLLIDIGFDWSLAPGRRGWPFNLAAFKGVRGIDVDRSVTFFVGENGSGKSTLLEAVAYRCRYGLKGGGRNQILLRDERDTTPLAAVVRLSWRERPLDGFFLRAETFYDFASHVDETGSAFGYGGKSLHELSHGEGFMALFESRFRDGGLFILDEPEAALSPQRQLAFLVIMQRLVERAGSQFLIATHSPILMAYPGAMIYDMNASPIKSIAYEATDHYQLTCGFLNDRAAYLRRLFQEEPSENASGDAGDVEIS